MASPRFLAAETGALDVGPRRRQLRDWASPHVRACFSHGRIGFAIGDIHGCADLLEKMLDRLARFEAPKTGVRPVVIFLGDYIDRGPQSREVIDLLIGDALNGFERRFLRGNHDQCLIDFIDDPWNNRGWMKMGGLETFVSYGVQPPSLNASKTEYERSGTALHQAIPPKHMAFFRSLELYAVYGDYAFVHAGIDPRLPIGRQKQRTLLWQRDGAHAAWDYVVVHGHTPMEETSWAKGRIAIDTGAYHTGRLSAVRLEGSTVNFLQVSNEQFIVTGQT